MVMAHMGKPLVTANQVTLTRLALLPIGTYLMYQGEKGLLAALGLLTLVGCTDILDGWLARRYGPTVLGGLMDPIVDKIFMVATLMPFLDLGWMPAWVFGLMLLREFLVTGLRSAYERRGLKLKTTLLAKIKTWVQMAGAGVICLMQLLPPRLMTILFLVGGLLPLGLALFGYLWRGRWWRGAFVFSGWFLAVFVAYILGGQRVGGVLLPAKFGTYFLLGGMVGVTWLSGWGYFAQSRRLWAVRALDASDLVRVGTAALPALLFLATPPSVPVSLMLNAALGLEMAAGGLDNLLCHHQAQSPALGWGLRIGLGTMLTFASMVLARPGGPLLALGFTAEWLMAGALLVTTIGTIAEFIRGRSYYLEDRFVDSPA